MYGQYVAPNHRFSDDFGSYLSNKMAYWTVGLADTMNENALLATCVKLVE